MHDLRALLPTESLLQLFLFEGIPDRAIRLVAADFAAIAVRLTSASDASSARAFALHTLLAARDATIRAVLYRTPDPV